MFFLYSCSKLNGKIEIRKLSPIDTVKSAFLVNTSKTKGYLFTIKKTSKNEDGQLFYETKFLSLNPGEEIEVGRETEYYGEQFSYKTIYDTFECVVNKFSRDTLYFKNGKEIIQPVSDSDDILYLFGISVNGEKFDSIIKTNSKETYITINPKKIIDETKPKNLKKIINKWEVTGEIETK